MACVVSRTGSVHTSGSFRASLATLPFPPLAPLMTGGAGESQVSPAPPPRPWASPALQTTGTRPAEQSGTPSLRAVVSLLIVARRKSPSTGLPAACPTLAHFLLSTEIRQGCIQVKLSNYNNRVWYLDGPQTFLIAGCRGDLDAEIERSLPPPSTSPVHPRLRTETRPLPYAHPRHGLRGSAAAAH